MQIQRLEVRSFRKLKHVVVDGLGPGLNVVVGDNEAGKSTLLAALRAVMFERHRVGGRALQAMLPHGHEVRPEIGLDFSLNGGSWRLRKTFNQRPEAELTMPSGETITGDAVEERLGALFGFQAPGSRGSRPEEHQGVYGLLWVDQGLAHGPLSAGAGQNSLAAAVETEVGQVVGGERGRQLLALAAGRRETFWGRSDKPRGAWRALQEAVDALGADREALRQRLAQHDDKVAALAIRAETLARHAREDRLNRAIRDSVAAQEATRRIAQLQSTLDALRAAAAGSAAERDRAAERLKDREALTDRAAAMAIATRRATDQVEGARSSVVAATLATRKAGDARAAARLARENVGRRLDALERGLARAQARSDRDRAHSALAEAERIDGRRSAAAIAIAGLTITKTGLAELDTRCAARDRARSRHDAASVQIVLEPETAETITVDGVDHPSGVPLLLARDAVLELPGFGRLKVRPGGGAEPLVRALEEAEAALATALRRLGQPSRDVAAEALGRKREAEADLALQEKHLALVAPDGLDALRRLAERMDQEAYADAEDAGPAPTHEDRTSLRQARAAAELAEAAADDELRRTEAARETAAREAAILDERAAAAERESAAAEQMLRRAREAIGDERLAGSLATGTRQAEQAAAAMAAAEAALVLADPEIAALEQRRAEQAEQAIRHDIERLSAEKREFEIELRTLGRDGVGEQLADTAGKLEAAEARLARETLEARASLLLHRTLDEASRETKDRWLGPVRERVRPYLRLVQPESDIVLNDKTFGIEHLMRGGVPEPFETLSVGAREQIAVITRLALADILHGSGQPSTIILDDALVNTDETRLRAMHLVLQRASRNLQVLVLTCREADFLGLGAPIHRL